MSQQLMMSEIRKTTKNVGYIGIFLFSITLAALFLHMLSIENLTIQMSVIGRTVFYIFVVIFLLLGVFFIYAALFINNKRGKKLIVYLENDPQKIIDVYLQEIAQKGEKVFLENGIPQNRPLYMIINYQDENQYQIRLSPNTIKPILDYVYEKAPHLK
ncbi:hypothetical protein [Candidatus Uabimicrobium sp. HlEnr_7]|uniref:hypothetical protein n=1 Tax=Candidatus Uabimicrobium helgolandensis TaxID=3095367 RepID=UPI0035587ECC